jgi:gliding motility-associated-like protein
MRTSCFSQGPNRGIPALALILALVFFALPATAQREYHQWLAGDIYEPFVSTDYSLAIFDFSTRPPRLPYRLAGTPDLPGFLEPRISATISTPCGELLYLSNGHKVLDALGNTLPNGDRLDSARTVRTDSLYQCPYSALFVPLPGSNTQTLLFSATRKLWQPFYPYLRPRPTPVLRYSLIERAADGTGARVTRRAIPLSTVGVAGVGATRHANRRDTWVMTRTLRGGKFLAYRVTPSGVSATPVVSPSGFNPDSLGGVTFSPDGRWVLFATRFDSVNLAVMTHLRWLALARFDAATGRVSEERIVSYNAFDGGFSADSRFIYVQNYESNVFDDRWRNVEQIALDPITGAAAYTGTIITKDPQMDLFQSGRTGLLHWIQNYVALAPNGSILLYCKRTSDLTTYYPSWFPIIRRPTLPDTACQFRVLGVSGDWYGGTGFSSINTAAMLDSVAEIRHLSTCGTDTVEFWLANPGCARGVRWNFGDPASGPANEAAGAWAPQHRFSEPGTYTVTATLDDGRTFQKAIAFEPAATAGLASPNIFTPNHDGLNDTFRPVATSGPVLRWAIYNRWGKCVWQTTDPTATWTGANCTEGVYYYLFTTTDCMGAPVERRGLVTLVR